MRLEILATAADVAQAVAHRVAGSIRATPSVVLGLAAGHTFIPVYEALRRLHHDSVVSFRSVRTFNLDEYVGLDGTAPGSFRRFIHDRLIDGCDFTPSSIAAPDGCAPDLDAECRRYDAAVSEAGGIDLLLLGIGRNGHVGFNEPGPRPIAECHTVVLLDPTRRANAGDFGGISHVPREAITLGMSAILQARAIILAATGADKASAIAAAVHGPITPWLPASLLQAHPAVDVYLDRDAAAGLPGVGPHQP